MEALKRMGERLESVPDEIGRMLMEIVMENEAFIIDAVAYSQLYEQGINKLGVSLSDYAPYAPQTVKLKTLKGQPTDRVTLEDTREFKESFYLDVDETGFEVKARDPKSAALTRKYGTEILGLTEENTKELMDEYVQAELTKRILEYVTE